MGKKDLLKLTMKAVKKELGQTSQAKKVVEEAANEIARATSPIPFRKRTGRILKSKSSKTVTGGIRGRYPHAPTPVTYPNNNSGNALLSFGEKSSNFALSIEHHVIDAEAQFTQKVLEAEAALVKETKAIQPLTKVTENSHFVQTSEQMLKSLKEDLIKNTTELLELDNKSIIELFAPTLKKEQKTSIDYILKCLRNKKLTPEEADKFIDLITKPNAASTQELESIIEHLAKLKTKNIKHLDIELIRRILRGRTLLEGRLEEYYSFIHDMSKNLSFEESESVLDILLGNTSKNMPSVIDSLGIKGSAQSPSIQQLLKNLGIKKSNAIKPTHDITLPDGTKMKVLGFKEHVMEFFGAKTPEELITKMQRKARTIKQTQIAGHTENLPIGINPQSYITVEIDQNILERIPEAYIEKLNERSYHRKFLRPDQIETPETLLIRYAGNDPANLIDINPTSIYDTEIKIRDCGYAIADRLLGKFDPKTRTIYCDTFSYGGLHSRNQAPSIFIGPKK